MKAISSSLSTLFYLHISRKYPPQVRNVVALHHSSLLSPAELKMATNVIHSAYSEKQSTHKPNKKRLSLIVPLPTKHDAQKYSLKSCFALNSKILGTTET